METVLVDFQAEMKDITVMAPAALDSDSTRHVVANQDGTFTLPSAPAEGDFYYIKNHFGADATVTVAGSGGKNVDGQSSIVLDVPGAAVKVVYDDDNGNWFIF